MAHFMKICYALIDPGPQGAHGFLCLSVEDMVWSASRKVKDVVKNQQVLDSQENKTQMTTVFYVDAEMVHYVRVQKTYTVTVD